MASTLDALSGDHGGCTHPQDVELKYLAMYSAAKDMSLDHKGYLNLLAVWWPSLVDNCKLLIDSTFPERSDEDLYNAFENSYRAQSCNPIRDYIHQLVSLPSPTTMTISHSDCDHSNIRIALKYLSHDMNRCIRYNLFVLSWDESYTKGCKRLTGLLCPPKSDELMLHLDEAIQADSLGAWLSYLYQSCMRSTEVQSQIVNTIDVQATKNAFHGEYVGGAADLLLHIMDNANDMLKYEAKRNFYSNSFVVIQSSGMGKSRTVAEAARKRFAIIYTVREDTPGGYAFPDSDTDILAFLTCRRAVLERKMGFSFLISSFERMEYHVQENSIHQAEQWCLWLEENRRQFCREVITRAEELILEPSVDKLYNSLKITANRLLKCTGNKFFICFDEAHTLLPTADLSGWRPYDELVSALCDIHVLDISAVFMSTESSLGGLDYTTTRNPSFRAHRFARLYPPITELPFDIFTNKDSVTMQTAMTVDHASQYGRPLWFSMHTALKKAGSLTTVVNLAIHKLMPYEYETDAARFAWLSIRIGLDIDGARGPDAFQTEAALVRSFMRVVFVMPEHRMFMQTGTPSEPVLVEAAAQSLIIFAHKEKKVRNTTIADVYVWIFYAAIRLAWDSKGDIGELVLRLIWIIARDAAAEHLQGQSDPDILPHMRPVKVLEFLRELLEPSLYAEVIASKPVGDENGDTLEVAFRNAYINFSHFAQAGDLHVLQSTYMARLLMRGVALQCTPTQSDINAIAPVHFSNGDLGNEQISPASTGRMQGRAQSREMDTVLIYPAVAGSKHHPVLTLVHEFDSPDIGVSIPDYCVEARSGINAQNSHYQITIKGLDTNVYGPKILSADSASVLRSILTQNRFKHDYPRFDDKRCLDAVQALKPDFTKNNVVWGP